MAIEMTVSGNLIDSSRIGRVSHSVSPVMLVRRPMMPTMSPARRCHRLLVA
jgi:hypothetical protein